MAAARVTNLDMPPKVSNDELFATEVEAIRRVVNEHADELDAGSAKSVTLAAAQALLTAVPPAEQVKPLRYAITGNWNATGAVTTVYVFGLSARAFASTGWVVDGSGVAQAVLVEVEAGAWEPAPPLTATQLAQVAALSKPFYALRATGLVGYDSLFDAVSGGASVVQFQRVQFTPADAVLAGDLNILSAGGSYQNNAATALTTDGGYLNLYQVTVNYVRSGTGPIQVHNGIVQILEIDGGEAVSLFNAPISAVIGTTGTIILYPGTPDLPAPVPAGITVIDRRGGVTAGVTPAQLATVATTLPVTTTRIAAYTLQLSDAGYLVPVSSSSAVTVTVPPDADVPFPIGTSLFVAQDGSGQVSIAQGANVFINTAGGYKVPGQWQDVELHKRAFNTWVLKGGV